MTHNFDNFGADISVFLEHLNNFFPKASNDFFSPNDKVIMFFYNGNVVRNKINFSLNISITFNEEICEYLEYEFNFEFNHEHANDYKDKILFHLEPEHTHHFQPHINVEIDGVKLKSPFDEKIHIPSKIYHPFEILDFIHRYFEQKYHQSLIVDLP